MFTLAHLSDPHLAPLPRPKFWQLANKRLSGYLSWKINRQKIHRRDILNAMTADIIRHAPDHVALTGDLVNIALPAEFTQARQWLNKFGSADWISVIPGNHDAYVKIPKSQGISLWADYMTSDAKAASFLGEDAPEFPFVRLRGKIAIVGLSTAVPKPLWVARGTLGDDQIERATKILTALGAKDYFRVVLIHHPPLSGQNAWRKALSDAEACENMLITAGADLVLHGHNHRDMYQRIETSTGPACVIGVPSASMSHTVHKPAARYNLYQISRKRGKWQCSMTEHAYHASTHEFKKIRELDLI